MCLVNSFHNYNHSNLVNGKTGSTIQAVYFLEKSGFRSSLMEAVEAATMKSKQTGRKE